MGLLAGVDGAVDVLMIWSVVLIIVSVVEGGDVNLYHVVAIADSQAHDGNNTVAGIERVLVCGHSCFCWCMVYKAPMVDVVVWWFVVLIVVLVEQSRVEKQRHQFVN